MGRNKFAQHAREKSIKYCLQGLSKNNVIMIRDAFNIKVEEIARYFGYSRMLVNDQTYF